MEYMKVNGVKIIGFYTDEIIEHKEEIERDREKFIPISDTVKHKIIDEANWQLVEANVDKYTEITMDLFYNYFVNIPIISVELPKTEIEILKEEINMIQKAVQDMILTQGGL